jgi:hypothetical protein
MSAMHGFSARKILASRIEAVPCKQLSNQPSHDSNIARDCPSLSVQTSTGPISAPRCSMILSIEALAAHTSVAEVGNSAAACKQCESLHAGGQSLVGVNQGRIGSRIACWWRCARDAVKCTSRSRDAGNFSEKIYRVLLVQPTSTSDDRDGPWK